MDMQTQSIYSGAAFSAFAATPRLAHPWPAQGGIYAGIVIGRDEDNYILILGPQTPRQLSWHDAQTWANELALDGHDDFSLPNRRDAAVLYGNCKEKFQKSWHWLQTLPRRERANGRAWSQHFRDGSQLLVNWTLQLSATAVRRIPI